MISDLEDFHYLARQFIHAFNAFVRPCQLKGLAWADHICYKCDSARTFEEMRALFESEKVSEFIYQSNIAGRRIACVQLRMAIRTALGPIRLLELSDKKPRKEERSHFDHIEVYPKGISYASMVNRVEKAGIILKKDARPHHTTLDALIDAHFKLRLTREPLMNKIIRDEISRRIR